MPCSSCGRGFHDECFSDCKTCHPEPQEVKAIKVNSGVLKIGRPEKDFHQITDPLSTGRKRAARDYKLEKDQPCEWQGLKNCGGGLNPIIGCLDGKQIQRHHGPIKDPRHNESGNVHRICTKCHRRWHARNDPVYDEGEYSRLPHRPEPAQSSELAQNEIDWKRGKYREQSGTRNSSQESRDSS